MEGNGGGIGGAERKEGGQNTTHAPPPPFTGGELFVVSGPGAPPAPAARTPRFSPLTHSLSLIPLPPPLLPPPPPSDLELAKFEAFLKKEGGAGVSALVRGRQRLAYPIKGYWEGVYVLYRFSAKRATSQGVQKLLSTPAVGAEANVLRHMTFAT